MRDRADRVSYAVSTTNDLAARIWSSSAAQQSYAIADEIAANPNSIRCKRDITINDVDSDVSSGALAIYEESLILRRRLAEIDPRNNQWQRDTAYFLDRIGDEYRKVGMRERAIAAYEESLAVWRHLAKIDRRCRGCSLRAEPRRPTSPCCVGSDEPQMAERSLFEPRKDQSSQALD